jgi:hypothetical protein
MSKDLKGKALNALPYVAVAGVAIAGIYALTKLIESVDKLDDMDLDFGNDPVLSDTLGKK